MEYLGMESGAEFKSYLELIRLRDHVQWSPRVHCLLDQSGSVLVDRIERLEAFDEDCR